MSPTDWTSIAESVAVSVAILIIGLPLTTLLVSLLFDLAGAMRDRVFIKDQDEAPLCVKCQDKPRLAYSEPTDARRWKPYCKECSVEISTKWKRKNRAKNSEINRKYYQRKKARNVGTKETMQ